MRLRQTFYIATFLLFVSCATKNNSNSKQIYKDTVVKEFLQYTSQSKFFDTTDYNYKILKAHFYNDTIFLKQVISDIERSKKQKMNDLPDSIRKHPLIDKLIADEAYQFNFTETFCDLSFYFTIFKTGDTINLHSVIYQVDEQHLSVKPIKESEVRLTSKQWDEFENLIDYADFWGLTQYKESIGFDGDYLSVEALIRNRFDHHIVKQRRVDRRFVTNTALHSAYLLLAKFANYKSNCN